MNFVEILLLFFIQIHKMLCLEENWETRCIIRGVFRKHIKCGVENDLFERLYKKEKSTCHPERSRNFSERTVRKNRGAIATKGSPNKFWWLTKENVTSL